MSLPGGFRKRILLHAEGVINFTVSGNLCEIMVDDGERRLGSLIAMLSQGGATIKRVNLGQTDLEDVFIEFARGEENPHPLQGIDG